MNKSRWMLMAGMLVSACGVNAGLEPISDTAMSEVTGQAFVSVDREYHPDANNSTSYTRVNLGMDIEIQTNIDTLELGRYERTGEKADSSDVLIDDFSLGYIENSELYADNPKLPRMFKQDGSAYQDGEIVPFMLENPFFEFAYDETLEEIVGFRLGFGNAKGVLSGKIETLTGNVNIDIIDRGEGLSAASSSGNLFDQMIVALTPLLEGDSPLQTKAELVYGEAGDPNLGELDPIRAEYIGIPNGEKFVLKDADGFTRWSLKNLIGWGSSSEIEVPDCSFFSCNGKGDIYVYAQDCKILGIDGCFKLDMYNSFSIGKVETVNDVRQITESVDGAFVSFQTKDLDWLEDVKNGSPTAADFVRATTGAFFNIPSGATEVNLNEALNGIQRYRSEYIDRGNGLF